MTSRPLCGVKRRRARLALRWGTAWEALVLFLFFALAFFLPVAAVLLLAADYHVARNILPPATTLYLPTVRTCDTYVKRAPTILQGGLL